MNKFVWIVCWNALRLEKTKETTLFQKRSKQINKLEIKSVMDLVLVGKVTSVVLMGLLRKEKETVSLGQKQTFLFQHTIQVIARKKNENICFSFW